MWKIEPCDNTYLIIFRNIILDIFLCMIKFNLTRVSLIRPYLITQCSICLKGLIVIFLKQIWLMKSFIFSKLCIDTLSELCCVILFRIVLVWCNMNLLIISLVFKETVFQSISYCVVWSLFKLKFLILRIVCISR